MSSGDDSILGEAEEALGEAEETLGGLFDFASIPSLSGGHASARSGSNGYQNNHYNQAWNINRSSSSPFAFGLSGLAIGAIVLIMFWVLNKK